MIFCIFFTFAAAAAAAASHSFRRCQFMAHHLMTDRPPFDGKSISCAFYMDYNYAELETTTKLLNGTLVIPEKCKTCSYVTLPRLQICKSSEPDFCKNIVTEADECRKLNCYAEIIIYV